MELAEDLLVIGAVAFGGYLLYKQLFGSIDDTQAQNALSNAGLNVYSADDNSGDYYAASGDTTYKFQPGDASRLNGAQLFLIGLDKVVPGHFLTDWALS